MSDVDAVFAALPRIQLACRAEQAPGGASAGVVTAHQANLLSYLDPVDPTMVTELAEFMGVTPSTMSLNLKRLREAGFVTSERDPADRRVVNVRLTDAGVRMKRSATELDRDRVEAMLGRLTAEEHAVALQGLVILARSAEALITGAVPATFGGISQT
jgi:DNA-binding MarR family transcriptional regulator